MNRRPNREIASHGKSRLENRVRHLRKSRGLRQQDLAELLGVSRQTVIAIEAGRYDPSLPLAFDIARVFASRIEDVFRRAETDGATSSCDDPMILPPKRLEGSLVNLRRHRASDLVEFQRFVTDPEATKFMAFTKEQRTASGAAELMDFVIASYASDTPILSLTIADKNDDVYVGAVGGAPSGYGIWEVFITVMPDHQKCSYGTEAMRLLIGFLFKTGGAKELRADTVVENEPSIALFTSLGFKETGPIKRAAEQGAFAHREMVGVRFTLTRAAFTQGQVTR